jgi:hypothetical protein
VIPHTESATISLAVRQRLPPRTGPERRLPRLESFRRIALKGYKGLIRLAVHPFLSNMRQLCLQPSQGFYRVLCIAIDLIGPKVIVAGPNNLQDTRTAHSPWVECDASQIGLTG